MNEELRKIQLIEYDLYKELFRVCKKHGLRVFLAQGTLIGAVRYGAFIPWDDDMDVLMPYEDAQKLMEVFPKEARSDCFLTDHTVERHYPLMWKKIRARGTLSRPKRYKDIPINWGICIDIFPIYALHDGRFARRLDLFFYKTARKLLYAEMTKYEPDHGILVRLLEKLPLGVRHAAARFAERRLLRNPSDSKYVYIPCKGGYTLERNVIFGPEATLRFEDGDYPVPSDYKRFLTIVFGPDYMTPPPEDQRGGHDRNMGSIEWSCDTGDTGEGGKA